MFMIECTLQSVLHYYWKDLFPFLQIWGQAARTVKCTSTSHKPESLWGCFECGIIGYPIAASNYKILAPKKPQQKSKKLPRLGHVFHVWQHVNPTASYARTLHAFLTIIKCSWKTTHRTRHYDDTIVPKQLFLEICSEHKKQSSLVRCCKVEINFFSTYSPHSKYMNHISMYFRTNIWDMQ